MSHSMSLERALFRPPPFDVFTVLTVCKDPWEAPQVPNAASISKSGALCSAFSAFVRLCSRLMLMTRDEHHRTCNDVDGLCAGCSVSMAGMETLRAGCLPETDRGITVGRGFLCYGTGLLCGWDVPRIHVPLRSGT